MDRQAISQMPNVNRGGVATGSFHLKRAEVVTAQHDNAAVIHGLTSHGVAHQLITIRFQFATDACAHRRQHCDDTRSSTASSVGATMLVLLFEAATPSATSAQPAA
jgi:hypothetical protein